MAKRRRLTVICTFLRKQVNIVHLSYGLWTKFWLDLHNCLTQISHLKLTLLLGLPYHTFWSHVMFDRTLLTTFGRLLKRLPRPHDRSYAYQDEQISKTLKEIMSLTFRVVLRMSTYKESKQDFMSPEFFSRIIYENFIFDIPKLLDICSIFIRANRRLVEKLVGSLFKIQPNYLKDLKQCSSQILQTFHQLVTETEKIMQSRQDFVQSSEFEHLGGILEYP